VQKFDSIDEILDFAIKEEQKAVDMYLDLANKTKSPSVKKQLEIFANEEKKHKAKILQVKEGNLLALSREKVMNLKIAEYMADIDESEVINYQTALIFAMKKEKIAYRMYTELASVADDLEVEALFLELAQEEAKHKLHFEIEYDDHVHGEN